MVLAQSPKTAKRIVGHFGNKTLEIFEENIESLTDVPGIAKKKLKMISEAWSEHRAIREVMMFLQSHGISTLFAVRIYKLYGDNAIMLVTEDPYRLATDFYGIGFFSADKIALSISLAPDSSQRIMAAIKHVLSAGRDFGHCYLTKSQIKEQVTDLLDLDLSARLPELLSHMSDQGAVMVRELTTPKETVESCYYSKSLYYDELYVAKKISTLSKPIQTDSKRIEKWTQCYCQTKNISLSNET